MKKSTHCYLNTTATNHNHFLNLQQVGDPKSAQFWISLHEVHNSVVYHSSE
jgi:hypothetical protein